VYADVDPVNRRDPSGRMSLLDVGVAMAIMGTNATGNFPTGMAGAALYFENGEHYFDYINVVCYKSEENCNTWNVYQGLLRWPAPVQGAGLGLGRPVTSAPAGETVILWGNNPVTSRRLPGQYAVRNDTQPGHVFKGYVEREVVVKANGIYIHSLGYGVGARPIVNVIVAKVIWEAMDAAISSWVKDGASLSF
jgi:hypothetical protein